MDEMSNYVASGWKRDLMHIIGCAWAAQGGPLDSEEWEVAIHKFLAVMRNRRAVEWTDIKELSPLDFMPYMAKLFKNVMGKDLKGLSDFTGWIGLEGYYHWKLAYWASSRPALASKGNRYPKDPWPDQADPQRLTQTGTQATGASGRCQDGVQLTSDWSGKKSTSNQGGKTSTLNQGGKTSTSSQGSKPASAGRGGKQAAAGGPVDPPPKREGVGNGA